MSKDPKIPVLPTPRQMQEHFRQGRNITSFLRELEGLACNSEAMIEVAYDLQSGRYIQGMLNEKHGPRRLAHAQALAREIKTCCILPESILEAGVGEASTLATVLTALGLAPSAAYGFDLSWSRVAMARSWLDSQALPGVTLCTGSLVEIPFADASVDLVYTAHAIEPNGGREESILRELYRVARRWLVLVEPCYELAEEPARERMKSYGYCREVAQTCRRLGYEVVKHERFEPVINPLNPAAVTVIRKPELPAATGHVLACPRYKTPLRELGGMLFSPEALAVYPVLCGIPCLRSESAILASCYPDFFEGGQSRP